MFARWYVITELSPYEKTRCEVSSATIAYTCIYHGFFQPILINERYSNLHWLLDLKHGLNQDGINNGMHYHGVSSLQMHALREHQSKVRFFPLLFKFD